MSTPPKEPKPEEARRGGAPNLESTYLGVAPIVPEPLGPTGAVPAAGSPSPAAGGSAAAGSAIIATPMISVSDRSKRAGAAPPQAAQPQAVHVQPQAAQPQAVQPPAAAAQPAAPPRPTGLQGGWQSAGIPRALGFEQTALHGSPGAWPMPPAVPRQQPAAAPPQTPPVAPAARAATPNPGPVAGLQHTALASDYLRNARDAAQGGAEAAVQQPIAQVQPGAYGRPAAESPAAQPEPRRAQRQESVEPAPQVQVPAVDLNATVASGGFVSPLPTAPPPTQGPPPTAELSSPAPIPLHTVSQGPVQVSFAEPERGPSPRSMNTQASVAPPPGELGASFHGPMAAAVHEAAPAPPAPPAADRAGHSPSPMAAAPSPVRHVIPQALVGTMLDRTPSVPGKELPQGGPPPPANPTLRFEQVPPPRSSLAQQATSFGLNIPIDHNATQWGRPAHDGKTKALPGRKPKARSQWRMVVLAALALLSVVFAAFGPELRAFAVAELNRLRPDTAGRGGQPTAAADQATLTNLPGPAPGVPAASGEAQAAAVSTPAAVAAPAHVAAEPAVPPAEAEAGAAAAPPAPEASSDEPEPSARKSRRGARGREAKAQVEAAAAAAAAASPESKLAAEAGRHVLAARFADALPLYRTLQRDYPQNTAYAAMTRVLEQKLSAEKQSGAQP